MTERYCECVNWARCEPVDLRGFDHHSQCPKFTKPVYVDISLKGGGRYIQPIDKVDALIDEIKSAAECGSIDSEWTVRLQEMSPLEYSRLPEFTGH